MYPRRLVARTTDCRARTLRRGRRRNMLRRGRRSHGAAPPPQRPAHLRFKIWTENKSDSAQPDAKRECGAKRFDRLRASILSRRLRFAAILAAGGASYV